MRILAVDPATDGAAVLVEGEDSTPSAQIRVLGAVVWTGAELMTWVVPRGGQLGIARHIVQGLAFIGNAIPRVLGNPDAIVVEDTFVGVNQKIGLRVARSAGRLDGGIQLAVGRMLPCREVLPVRWRSALGLPHAINREAAKSLSLSHVPRLLPGIVPFLDLLGHDCDHLTDAAGIALVGLRYGAWSDEHWRRLNTPKARSPTRRRYT